MSASNSSPVVAVVAAPNAAVSAIAPVVEGAAASTPPVAVEKKKRGRPKGSKNKPKVVDGAEGTDVPTAKKPRRSSAANTPGAAKQKQPQRKRLSVKAVNEILKAHGVESGAKEVSHCLRAGIMRGHIKVLKPEEDANNEYGLDQVLKVGGCLICGDELRCTVRDLLYQPDYGGMDYEDGGECATLRCPSEDCGGVYVTRICQGSLSLDSGKFHNHCTQCPGFGSCIGDYREAHCNKCGGHYWNGGFHGGKCHKCFPNSIYEDDDYF